MPNESWSGVFTWTCEKWSEEACDFVRKRLYLPELAPVSSAQLREVLGKPEEVLTHDGNLLLNEGIQMLEDLMIAALSNQTTGQRWNNADSQLGVGDSSTAAAASQTDLQASTNKLFKAMNATFPSRSSQTVTWQSDFLTAEANFAWQEWSIRSGSSEPSAKNLNRAVASLGTKTTGTWTLSGAVTLS